MVDFFIVSTRSVKGNVLEIYPKFIVKKTTDLMIRGGDFYAVWLEKENRWSTDEQDVIDLVDNELDRVAKEKASSYDGTIKVLHLWDSESGQIEKWHRYCQSQLRDNFHMLDGKIIFSNMEVTKEDYSSKRLNYPLEHGDLSAYEKLMSTLYSPKERHKIEWAIGSIVSGDSRELQKFMVLYGAAGTGKSTVLKIIQMLFRGYCANFDAKALGSSSNAFALEPFQENPLVAIQHDGDLSKIEDNTRINSLVSHEEVLVNQKFKSTYSSTFKCFIFIGSNNPVKITDAKSGIIRRLIDVTPTGVTLPTSEYTKTYSQIKYELGAIASHCLDIYNEDHHYYDNYIPIGMIGASNDFYNYVEWAYDSFKKEDKVTLAYAWELYKTYCDFAQLPHKMQYRLVKEELKNYFYNYADCLRDKDGSRVRNLYWGFRTDKFEPPEEEQEVKKEDECWITEKAFKVQHSTLDDILANCPAQYATDDGKPKKAWDNVTTVLSDLDTKELHYVRPPLNHIIIDFDIPDENGEKSLEKNIEAASQWPATYAELSKSGQGIHLHYIYSGDVEALSRVFDEHIEVKVFNGKSSLRRKLSKCINLAVAVITSGLALKKAKDMINFENFKNEAHLRNVIKKHLSKIMNKQEHTAPVIQMIYKCLDQAYESGMEYDVSDMRHDISTFATNSSHQASTCLKLVMKMKFKSDTQSENKESDGRLAFYDVEVFPNLFLVNWKYDGETEEFHRLVNPQPNDIRELIKHKLVGFNCRRYDNHILYGCMMGFSNEELYHLSQKIINGEQGAFFGQAYNISYTDIYDFSSEKKSLKQFEIDLGIHHQELGLPWDQPVPEAQWEMVSKYCDNDVMATEILFHSPERQADFVAREILADLAGMSVNDTTNSLTEKIIFGNDKNPQTQFNYRDLADISDAHPTEDKSLDPDYTFFDSKGRPVFPGYTFDYDPTTKRAVSMYRGEELGEGGKVYAEPGTYTNVALLDIASMHPSSIEAEELFGPTYTRRFSSIKSARIAIKHKDYATARTMMDGKLQKYIDLIEQGKFEAKALAQALKIVINSVYGLTSAKFSNPFRDIRNKDNIVAKRGALFMTNLKFEVQRRGFTVAHIKTDSIKIPNATPEIIQFVMDYGKLYGYSFEHEATYERMCLVNDAVYIARYLNEDGTPGEWTATGTQFAVPYVFKTLFSHEPIQFEDYCETKTVTSALYLDMNENLAEDEHDYVFIGKCGSFCPIRSGKGGGYLMRQSKAKDGSVSYAFATGTKGYRWLEAEAVKKLNKQNDIDTSYHKKLVDEAVSTIEKYCNDISWFLDE